MNYIANNGVIALSNSVVSFVRSFNSYLQDAEKVGVQSKFNNLCFIQITVVGP